MSRQCKACVSPSRRKIDRLLLEGQSFATIGRRFSLSDDTVGRHFRTHVEKALQKHAAAERESLQRGARLEEQLRFIAEKAEQIFEQAQGAGNLSVALKALGELRESAKLTAIAAGELSDGSRTQVNVQVNVGDKLRDIRAYLLACHMPADLTDHIMGFITAAESCTTLEGQTTS
jgi:DNA-binding transcriptional ArsR family regulator